MKFSRTFNVVRRLKNNDLNVSGILCILNRACDEVVEAEEYLCRRARCEDIESRAVYSITDSKLDHGYYVLVNDDAFVVAMGISNDAEPHDYHMRKESNYCETVNDMIQRDNPRKIFEMFRISGNGFLGKGILESFKINTPGSYKVAKNQNVPVSIIQKNDQIIFSL